MLGLRVVALLVCWLAVLSRADRQKRSAWFFGPHYSAGHYYSGGYSHHHVDRYHRKPTCSPRRQCYDYVLLFSDDGHLNLTADARRFRDHYADAGFNKETMIAEGKHAAMFFLKQFGVDATGLPNETYLAPKVKLPGYVSFNFKVEIPPRPIRLTMAAKKDWTRFYNEPVRFAFWEMSFGKDYKSTGAFKGVVPAGGASRYGSYLIDTCPYQDRYYQCKPPSLSPAPRGRLLLRFWNRGLCGEVVDDIVEHKEWGKGTGRGVRSPDVKDEYVTHGRVALTFPESCGAKDKCHPRRIRLRPKTPWGHGGTSIW